MAAHDSCSAFLLNKIGSRSCITSCITQVNPGVPNEICISAVKIREINKGKDPIPTETSETGRSSAATTNQVVLGCRSASTHCLSPFHSLLSLEAAASAIRSRWRSSYVPRSLARPSRSPAGSPPHTVRDALCNVDDELDTQICSQWAWEPSGSFGTESLSRYQLLFFN